MKAMLFAAGLGTRLKPFTDHHPKALAVVNGKTLLEHNIRYLQRFGIQDVLVNVHHFANQIETAIHDNNGYGSNVSVSDERDAVLETGGGLLKAAPYFQNEGAFVVMNVDILTNLDLGTLIEAHNAGGSIATLAVMQRNSSRQLLFNKDMQLSGWQNNTTGEQKIARDITGAHAFAFSGIQVVTPKVLAECPFSGKFSTIDMYLHLAKEHVIKGYDHTGDLLIDVGKPESLQKASELF